MRRPYAFAVVMLGLLGVVAFAIHHRYFEDVATPPVATAEKALPQLTVRDPSSPPTTPPVGVAKGKPAPSFVAVLTSDRGTVFEEQQLPIPSDLVTNLLPEERELLASEPSGNVATLVARCQDDFLGADSASSEPKHERYRLALNLAAKLSTPVDPPPQSTIDKQKRYLRGRATAPNSDEDVQKHAIIDQ